MCTIFKYRYGMTDQKSCQSILQKASMLYGPGSPLPSCRVWYPMKRDQARRIQSCSVHLARGPFRANFPALRVVAMAPSKWPTLNRIFSFLGILSWQNYGSPAFALTRPGGNNGPILPGPKERLQKRQIHRALVFQMPLGHCQRTRRLFIRLTFLQQCLQIIGNQGALPLARQIAPASPPAALAADLCTFRAAVGHALLFRDVPATPPWSRLCQA